MIREPEMFTVEGVRFTRSSRLSWSAGALGYPVRVFETPDGPRYSGGNRRFETLEEAARHSVRLSRLSYDSAKRLVAEYEAELAKLPGQEAKP